ncbi:hypothetical protein [Vibrio splendidus]|uniref:hypothetical protein n=1 Tax=Vibrio splendidus TaxID=29497 RepID=UPI000D345B2A|nr:hypothetical protein [Vibrio splendidus]PTO62228.1 hypothetical protein CWN99_18870 [Vibrio splendidus]
MHEKVNQWLDIAERIINLIRPKAYNTIAKAVVLTGIGLIVESQVNFLHALVVALFEEYIGKSEILRSVLDVSSDPTVGVVLVVTGMMYHVAVTLGKEFIETRKAELPKFPDFEFFFVTKKQSSEPNGKFYLDGPQHSYEQLENIPKYEEPKPKQEENEELRELTASIGRLSNYGALGGFGRQREEVTNSRLYQERVDLLKEWMGFEPVKLKLSNGGEVLANGVNVQLTIPKSTDVIIKERGARLPENPKKKYYTDVAFAMVRDNFSNTLASLSSPVRFEEEEDFYEIRWDVKSLQACVNRTANKEFLIKVTKPVEVECTVFCNELPQPYSSTVTLHPASESTSLTLDDIVDDSKFDSLYSDIAESFKQDY